MKPLYVFAPPVGGHRADYNAVLDKELRACGLSPLFVDHIGPAQLGRDILFAMLDEAPGRFLLCAFASMIFRNRVTGLFFRPGECLRRSRPKYLLKFWIFRALKRLSTVRVVTILPFSVEPRFAEVADGWIYDLQLWDSATLTARRERFTTELSQDARFTARGRQILIALGAQTTEKGFDYLCDVWAASPALRARYYLVCAGQVAPELKLSAERLRCSGAAVIDRFVSDQEIGSLYGIADLIWSAYRPNYDQASGVAGRAFQFGVPVVVRRGSHMAKVLHALAHPVLDVDWDRPVEAAATILTPLKRLAAPHRATAQMRDAALTVLREALA